MQSCNRGPAFLFLTYLIVQIGVPTFMLAGPRPSRFGWQMFAGIRSLDTFSVVRHDASSDRIDLRTYFGNPRSDTEVDVPTFASRICSQQGDAIAVRVTNAMRGDTRDYPCERK